MAGVDDAQFQQFVWLHAVDKPHPNLFERRAAAGKALFHHPLTERLADHRRGVFNSQLTRRQRAFAGAGGRGDAVDHAVGESDAGVNPAGELRRHRLRQPHHRAAGGAPVARQVVARHHRKRRGVIVVASAFDERGDQYAEHGLRIADVFAVVNDGGMAVVETVAAVFGEIAALGDGQRDDSDIGVGERVNQRARAGLHFDKAHHRAADPGVTSIRFDFGDAAEPILRPQALAHARIFRPEPGADDCPVMPEPHAEQVVEIDRLMRAVKIAHADMHDARGQRISRVGGYAHIGAQLGERALPQSGRHQRYGESAKPRSSKRWILSANGVR